MSSTTAAPTPAAKTAGPAASSLQPKKRSMAATWHLKDPSTWSFAQKLPIWLDILQDPAGSERPPVYSKDTPVPVYPVWRQHVWILPRTLAPLLLHRAWVELTGIALPWYAAFFWYSLGFLFFGMETFKLCRRMGKKYGFFDGAVPRDGVPDAYDWKVSNSLTGVLFLRPLVASFFVYDSTAVPTLSWWLPVQVSAFCIILDLFFYVYHRLMHQYDFLWHLHSLHHATHHPNALLGAFADEIQEWGDILVIPILTWMVLPIDFYTWWVTTCYLSYTEASGHSGIRLYWMPPPTAWLRYFGVELVMEDHDLHHRMGSRQSFNYGKQTRLWDTLFGTARQRIECKPDNIDWKNTAVTQ